MSEPTSASPTFGGDDARPRWTRRDIAALVSADIPDGSFVNLGIGMPTQLANITDSNREIIFHSENGIVGLGRHAAVDEQDDDLINAGKEYVTVVTGAAFISHSDSFGLIRGGHLDLCVMGAFQVAANGDFANWKVPGSKIDAVGGAMDLAAGVTRVWIMMELFDKNGESKIQPSCTYPLTGCGVVERVYSDIAVFDLTDSGVAVTKILDGYNLEELQRRIPVPLQLA
ncbi:MAG: 3-oxoacid CoA-transferase subunit B [Acidimicrobiales bacterium]